MLSPFGWGERWGMAVKLRQYEAQVNPRCECKNIIAEQHPEFFIYGTSDSPLYSRQLLRHIGGGSRYREG